MNIIFRLNTCMLEPSTLGAGDAGHLNDIARHIIEYLNRENFGPVAIHILHVYKYGDRFNDAYLISEIEKNQELTLHYHDSKQDMKYAFSNLSSKDIERLQKLFSDEEERLSDQLRLVKQKIGEPTDKFLTNQELDALIHFLSQNEHKELFEKLSKGRCFDKEQHDSILEKNELLRNAYNNAGLIIDVSTYFPPSTYEQSNLSPKIQIREHNACSGFPSEIDRTPSEFDRVKERFTGALTTGPDYVVPSLGSSPLYKSYVLGIKQPDQSGLLVKDLEMPPTEAFKILMESQDQHKQPIRDRLNPNKLEMLNYLEKYCIVPIYVDSSKTSKIPNELTSILTSYSNIFNGKKIIAIIASRCYNETEITELKNRFSKLVVVTGIFFSDEAYQCLFSLADVAIVGGDKTLEMAISYNTYPIYVAPDWKMGFKRSLPSYLRADESNLDARIILFAKNRENIINNSMYPQLETIVGLAFSYAKTPKHLVLLEPIRKGTLLQMTMI